MDIFLISLATKILALLIGSVLPVSVNTNTGESIDGDLAAFTGDAVRIAVDGQSRAIPFDQLSSLVPRTVQGGTGPTFRVTLIGGTRIAAQELSLVESEFVVQPRRQSKIRIPIKQVKAIRFRAPNTATDPAWLGIVAQESRGDKLVIRRSEQRLDPQNGVVEGIEAGKVAFDLDGDKVNAPIDKLEGVVFGAADSANAGATIRVTDIYGSEWFVQSIEPSSGDQPLNIRFANSLSHSVPLDQIESIRWSGGLVLLAQQQPAGNSTKAYFQTNLDPKLIDKFFAAKAFDGEDIVAHGGSSIQYRIEPGYQTLAGAVHRLDSIRHGSSMKFLIKLDGETVWEQELVDGEPRGFELSVGDARRVAMIIDNGDDGDLGDTVRIVQPRLTK